MSATDYVAAQEVGFDQLCEIVDGTLRVIDTVINHVRGMVFHLTEQEFKESFRQCCRLGEPLSRQKGGSMKQYVSRRRRCWTLLVQMHPVIHVNEGHKSDMLLDLSGLTREERVVVQASINNERDFDKSSLLSCTSVLCVAARPSIFSAEFLLSAQFLVPLCVWKVRSRPAE